MSDFVIQARDLTKVYRLYASPRARFLDMFGWLRNTEGAYTEHAALAGVSLDIRRGEKVAFIGRNGAGKSTLLKLVTSVIQPTSGTLRVDGKAHALLQIGTGFHPDFTGRENIYAYLAQLGVTGRAADQRCAGIIDFAEIEEYIDQPVKTYSSGMSVRLMFAVSTAITPDLLILDEVLGVGDAYFARKSYDRIRELCDRDGTTLLLVSHDVYSASKICNRMVWLERGKIVADLPSSETIKLYEDAVRLQEEQRLRKKSLAAIRRSLEDAGEEALTVLTVDVAFANPQPVGPVYVSRIAVTENGRTLAEIEPATAGSSSTAARLITEGTAWGEVTEWNGRPCRALLPFGSVFGRVAVAFSLAGLNAARQGQLQVEVEVGAAALTEIRVGVMIEAAEMSVHHATVDEAWQIVTRSVSAQGVPASAVVRSMIGTGAVVLLAARVFDDAGQPSPWLTHGRPATLEFDYEIRDPKLTGPLDVAVSILRGGVETACRFFTRDLQFDGEGARQGTIRMHLPSVMLGVGAYSVIVMVARLGYADEEGHVFYSINPGVYACVRDILEFEVRGGNLFATGTPVVAPASWDQRRLTAEAERG